MRFSSEHKISAQRISPLLICCLVFLKAMAWAQEKILPNVLLKDLQGNQIDVSRLADSNKIVVLNFWATWCVPCKKELTNIAKVYEAWKAQYHMELIAISVDDARNLPKVKPTVQGSRWPYRVLLDPNGELKRHLGFQNVPFTVMAEPGGRIVYQHAGYLEGDEIELERQIKALRTRLNAEKN